MPSVNGWVQFLLRHDRKGVFRFASIQADAGQALLAQAGLKVDGLETLLLIDGQRNWQHTGAIFRVLDALGGPGGSRGSTGLLQRRLETRSIACWQGIDTAFSADSSNVPFHQRITRSGFWIKFIDRLAECAGGLNSGAATSALTLMSGGKPSLQAQPR